MNMELKIEQSLLSELEEAEKVDMETEDGVTYSVTYDFGGYLSIICC